MGKIVTKVNTLEEELTNINENDFKVKTEDLCVSLNNGSSLNEILPNAFALVTHLSRSTFFNSG